MNIKWVDIIKDSMAKPLDLKTTPLEIYDGLQEAKRLSLAGQCDPDFLMDELAKIPRDILH